MICKKLSMLEKAWKELEIRLEYVSPQYCLNEKNNEIQELYHQFLTIAYDLGYCMEKILNFDYINEYISFIDVEEVYNHIKYDLLIKIKN
jgi:hypothetical protein